MPTAKEEVLIAVELDAATGQVIERPFTDDEVKAHKAMQVEVKKQQAVLDAKAAARTSALAKLADLGLTAEEIAAL
jgi:hypothetical protein